MLYPLAELICRMGPGSEFGVGKSILIEQIKDIGIIKQCESVNFLMKQVCYALIPRTIQVSGA